MQSSMDRFVPKASPATGSSGAPPTWRNTLTNFENLSNDNVTSVWDSRIDFTPMVDSSLIYDEDRPKLKKIGPQEACQAMMTKGMEIAAIARGMELEMAGYLGEGAAKELKEKAKEVATLKKTMKLMEKGKKAEEKVYDLNLEVGNPRR
ncbi:hypothetical protein OROGR_023142 [Orobanche gracilis]